MFCFKCNSIKVYKVNDIINKFLLAGDKFMPEMHLKQPGFAYQEIQDISTKMNYIKLVFNIIWLMEILKI